MMFLVKTLLILIAVLLGFFVLTFLVYFFNLDMKLMAAVHPFLLKLYERRKRNRKL